MKEFFEQFKAFALRGNVVDMAVGVIIGGAFGKIVTSVVNDLVMPPIGVLIGGVDFSDLFINLGSKKVATLAEAQAAKMPVIAYGKFITNLIDFIVMAFVIFCLVTLMNKLKKEAPQEAPTLCPYCKQPVDPEATRCPHCTSVIAKGGKVKPE